MSLSFQLQEHKDLRESRSVQPLTPVTLWDMLRIHADRFVKSVQTIAYNRGLLTVLASGATARTHHTGPPITKHVLELRDQSTKMGLVATRLRCEDVLRLLAGNQIEIATLSTALINVRRSFERELKQEVFLQLKPGHGPLYSGNRAFVSSKALKNMPEVLNEAKRARRCFAVEEYTATAFHLIRITEYLIQGFLRKLGITPNPDKDTWGDMLKKAIDEIKSWDGKHQHRQYKKSYEACWNRLNGVCPSRNDLVHRNQNYSENDARDLKGSVELCMRSYSNLPDLV